MRRRRFRRPPGARVLIVTRSERAESSNTFWAQGDRRAPGGGHSESLASDIEKAGAGSATGAAVEKLAREGPELVRSLLVEELSVPFDRENGEFDWALEGAHSMPRVLHVKDETGVPIERALLSAVERGEVDPVEDRPYRGRFPDARSRFARSDGSVSHPRVRRHLLTARGNGRARDRGRDDPRHGRPRPGLSAHDQPRRRARGRRRDGGARPGARCSTSIRRSFTRRRSSTRRGGCSSRKRCAGPGRSSPTPRAGSFLKDFDPRGELAPRDIVARAIHRRMLEEDQPHVLLDISHETGRMDPRAFSRRGGALPRSGIRRDRGRSPSFPRRTTPAAASPVDLDGRTTLPSPVCRRARSHVPGCTAPTGSLRHRSSRVFCGDGRPAGRPPPKRGAVARNVR